MSQIARSISLGLLAASLILPLSAGAADAAAPVADTSKTAVLETIPMMPMMGMRHQMHAMAGDGMGPHCDSSKGMAGEQPPCMGQGGKCKAADALEHRIEAMEKRLDMMQMMLEMQMRQLNAAAK